MYTIKKEFDLENETFNISDNNIVRNMDEQIDIIC